MDLGNEVLTILTVAPEVKRIEQVLSTFAQVTKNTISLEQCAKYTDVIDACNQLLQSKISTRVHKSSSKIYVFYKNKKGKMSLSGRSQDIFTTIDTINYLVQDEYEFRVVAGTKPPKLVGSSLKTWSELQKTYKEAFEARFPKIDITYLQQNIPIKKAKTAAPKTYPKAKGSPNIKLIKQLIKTATAEAAEELMDDPETAFWIDRREGPENIIPACEEILKTGHLAVSNPQGAGKNALSVFVQYKNKQKKINLGYSVNNKTKTLITLNQILAPDFEVRYWDAKIPARTKPFVVLATVDWNMLEKEFGKKLHKHFHVINESTNMF